MENTFTVNRLAIEKEYIKACNTPSDINQHLPILRVFANNCKHVTEFGVRDGQSTRAFLASGAVLRSYDIVKNFFVSALFDQASYVGRDVEYNIGDTLKIDIEPTDMLFVDTEHTYEQVRGELNRHHHKVKKYIAFHDTTIFGDAIMPAIEEFLAVNRSWIMIYRVENNNGLTIIERV